MFGNLDPWVERVVNGLLIVLVALALVGAVSVLRWMFW
jgi:hypothetical protein